MNLLFTHSLNTCPFNYISTYFFINYGTIPCKKRPPGTNVLRAEFSLRALCARPEVREEMLAGTMISLVYSIRWQIRSVVADNALELCDSVDQFVVLPNKSGEGFGHEVPK